ncbi:YbaY family lipoprotein [Pluralibacter gergoviae]
MKCVHILSGLAVAVALSACADKSADIAVPAPSPNTSISAASQSTLRQPNVSGTIWIRQHVALPPNAVLTVTLSDATIPNQPSKVLSQKVLRTDGKQAPFSFILPFKPAEIKPDARILLSAAITVDNKLLFITDSVQTVLTDGDKKADLTLVPAPHTAVPIAEGRGPAAPVPPTSPTQVTPSSATPAPTQIP